MVNQLNWVYSQESTIKTDSKEKRDFLGASTSWKSNRPMSELWAKPVKGGKENNTAR